LASKATAYSWYPPVNYKFVAKSHLTGTKTDR
jgi:hypothetical protein